MAKPAMRGKGGDMIVANRNINAPESQDTRHFLVIIDASGYTCSMSEGGSIPETLPQVMDELLSVISGTEE